MARAVKVLQYLSEHHQDSFRYLPKPVSVETITIFDVWHADNADDHQLYTKGVDRFIMLGMMPIMGPANN